MKKKTQSSTFWTLRKWKLLLVCVGNQQPWQKKFVMIFLNGTKTWPFFLMNTKSSRHASFGSIQKVSSAFCIEQKAPEVSNIAQFKMQWQLSELFGIFRWFSNFTIINLFWFGSAETETALTQKSHHAQSSLVRLAGSLVVFCSKYVDYAACECREVASWVSWSSYTKLGIYSSIISSNVWSSSFKRALSRRPG